MRELRQGKEGQSDAINLLASSAEDSLDRIASLVQRTKQGQLEHDQSPGRAHDQLLQVLINKNNP